ncbi:hypothetical protein MYCTH_2113755 [Thermothelomyces thermophilus ATCC 42464]|uniref:Uncharacterized protein n=1 Tax=Thermothelomyces thermophilus (strain ATCC 42464 / BCRC 31852 / DSM 1799) TaxID=573729 RepID=G2QN03_THET4|nr:uncharacterized protein MYCTH_2113755 [Thermothelomyces thermophilus ATCC 42464]AEO61876.1 hypothetical protein MYCTH_2113755 [Thermothelomyces thermophilus ATCC 42464]
MPSTQRNVFRVWAHVSLLLQRSKCLAQLSLTLCTYGAAFAGGLQRPFGLMDAAASPCSSGDALWLLLRSHRLCLLTGEPRLRWQPRPPSSLLPQADPERAWGASLAALILRQTPFRSVAIVQGLVPRGYLAKMFRGQLTHNPTKEAARIRACLAGHAQEE